MPSICTGWRVTYPPSHTRASRPETIDNAQLPIRLLAILRAEEIHRGSVRRSEQFDRQWGTLIYGHSARDSNMAAAGCGPSTLESQGDLAAVLDRLRGHTP